MKRAATTLTIMTAILALTAFFSNCSTVNQDSPFSFIDETGKHFEGWITSHGPFASPDGGRCMDCHGEDLDGGISGVSCFTGSYNGEACHATGPAFHPSDWLDSSLTGNDWHGDAYNNGFLINGLDCVDCHDPLGVAWPDGGNCVVCHFTPDGGRSPGGWTHGAEDHSSFLGSPEEVVCVTCHNINNSFGNEPFCHNCHEIIAHGVPYLDHYLAVPASGDYTSQCSICHSMSDPPVTSAPVCTSCHIAGSPYVQTSCRSCHGRPPNSGEHGEHGSNCSNCHYGAGTGSGLNHFYDGAVDVVFEPSINLSYNGSSCTGDCHGEGHNNSW